MLAAVFAYYCVMLTFLPIFDALLRAASYAARL